MDLNYKSINTKSKKTTLIIALMKMMYSIIIEL